jgi:hypothetical protein
MLEGDFLAGVAGGEIDLAKATFADAPFDRIPVEWARTTGVLKFHGTAQPGWGSLRHGDIALAVGI